MRRETEEFWQGVDRGVSMEELSVLLWRCVIAYAGESFRTSGRGGKGSVEYRYLVRQEADETLSVRGSRGKVGQFYAGAPSVPGYFNEIAIVGEERSGRQKTITRSSFDRALEIALEFHQRGEVVKGPKKLEVYGASYIFPIFRELGLTGEEKDSDG